MATVKKRISFFDSIDGVEIAQMLEDMANDSTFNTGSSYSANAERYPNNLIPFVDKHMNYLNTHPGIDPLHYLANLRLMTRIK